MKTGDMLLFKGTGVFSAIITALPGSDYSHIGMYVEAGHLPWFRGDCVFESTSLGTLPDLRTGQPIRGVQLVDFRQRAAHYEGEVFHREIVGIRRMQQIHALVEFIEEHHGKPYEQSNWELVSAEIDHLPWHVNKEDDSSMFCSETYFMALRAMDILDYDGTPANEFTPSDGAGYMAFKPGYGAGAITRLKGLSV